MGVRLIGAMIFEGMAATPEEAEAKLAAGEGITFRALPATIAMRWARMAGVIQPDHVGLRVARPGARQPVLVLAQRKDWARCCHGAYGPEVIDRLHWMNSVLGPLLRQAARGRADRHQGDHRKCCRWATGATTVTAPAR